MTKPVQYLYCDNYQYPAGAWTEGKCQSAILYDERLLTFHADRARAKGWHIWEGVTMGGKTQRVVLCPQCVGPRRKLPSEAKPLRGDQTLF